MTLPLTSLFHKAMESGSKSTVLKPLAWFIAICASSSISASYFSSPDWLCGTFGVLCIIGMLMYLVAYIYFAITDKDSLRSEKYSIQKMAIQKGFFGDDVVGYTRVSNEIEEGKTTMIAEKANQEDS